MKNTTKKRGFQTQISAAFDDLGLPVYEFRLYCHILRRGNCWESVPNMAKHCRIGKDRAWKAVGYLLEKGLIREIPPARKGQKTNTYVANQMSGIQDTSDGSGIPDSGPDVSAKPDTNPSDIPDAKDYPTKDYPMKGKNSSQTGDDQWKNWK